MLLLRELATKLKGFTADYFYQTLLESGCSTSQATRLTGACLRTASAEKWIVKSHLAFASKRNSSNVQFAWGSKIYRASRAGRELQAKFDALGFPRVGTAAELAVFHDAVEFR